MSIHAFSFAVIAEPGDGLLPSRNLHDLRKLHIRAADAVSGNLQVVIVASKPRQNIAK
jgi:hypothetical protein